MSALRVLYVSPHAAMGGAERVTLDLLTLHDRAAVEPSVCFLEKGPLVDTCRALGVPTFVVEAPRLRRVFAVRRAVRALADIIRSHGIQLVHSAMAWGHCFGGRAAAQARQRAVWFQHTGATWGSMLDVRAALVRADAILANSDFTAAVQHRVNPRRIPIHTVHPGTRLPVTAREVRRSRGRASLGIGEGEFAVGIVARLQPWKGQHVLLRAAASLLHARDRARLFVIGDTLFGLDQDYPAALHALARDLAITERVVFAGFRNDVADCLAAMDIAVHASIEPEPFGLGLIEAMAAGTALVASRAGATPEIVTDGIDGLLVPPGDHEALAVALLALHDDPDRREALAEAGLATARERFDVHGMVSRMEGLYHRVVGA
jgi:glycosyltransferase involved in cell wall biosynthesis